jgi:hypothetical protein
MRNHINSIAIYGSKARRDYDQHSDNDLLVVAEKFDNQFDIEKHFNDQGFSCSAYTFNRLQNLSDKKALFIQHLKQDAKLILDDGDRLNKLLTNFAPKESYDHEIGEAISYFNLLKFIPDTVEGLGWAFDVIAIGIRNFNILKLANYKIYEFSLKEILSNSQRIFNLTNSEVELLLNTRIAKKYYRTKELDLLPSKVELLRTIHVIEKRYSININPVFLNEQVFNQYSFSSLYSNLSFTAYQKLRLFETFVMTSKNFIPGELLQKCRRIIENPKFYVSNFSDGLYIDNLLMELYLSH